MKSFPWRRMRKYVLMSYSSFLSVPLVVDSDSDTFQTLKKVPKTKPNGTAKPTKSRGVGTPPGAKVGVKSPIKTLSTQSKLPLKSPVTPKKATPTPPKRTPTSVNDYFGSRAIQRSDKKLVASTKRKAVSIDEASDKDHFTPRLTWHKLLSAANSGYRWFH